MRGAAATPTEEADTLTGIGQQARGGDSGGAGSDDDVE
jgi:hypothetical protein